MCRFLFAWAPRSSLECFLKTWIVLGEILSRVGCPPSCSWSFYCVSIGFHSHLQFIRIVLLCTGITFFSTYCVPNILSNILLSSKSWVSFSHLVLSWVVSFLFHSSLFHSCFCSQLRWLKYKHSGGGCHPPSRIYKNIVSPVGYLTVN